MIITKIRLQELYPMATASASWPLPVCDLHLDSDAGKNGYLLKASQGLGPPEITEVVDGFDVYGTPSTDDISEKRELVFKIGLNPGIGQSYSSLRDEIYKLLSRTVLISLMDEHDVIAKTVGHIHQVETTHFTNKPEIQLTVQCYEGDFSSTHSVAIPFGDLNVAQPIIIYSEGTAPTGLDLQFTIASAINQHSIYNHARVLNLTGNVTYNMFQINYAFLVGDIINVSTKPNDRRITRTRSGVVLDLAGYLNAGAVWPKLYPGVNTFEWSLYSTWVTWTVASYTPRYWGV